MDLVDCQSNCRSIIAHVLGTNDARSAILPRSNLSMDSVPSDGLVGNHRFDVMKMKSLAGWAINN